MNRIRTIIFGVYLALDTLVVGTLGVVTLPFGAAGGRLVNRVWAKGALLGLNLICGIRHRVVGGSLPTGAAIIAANHQSMWETIAFFALAEKPAMIFKRELLNIPVYGWWGRLAGSIPVDRDAGARAIKDLTRETSARLAEGCQIVVFPEGTRGAPGATLPLQSGVAAIYKAAPAPTTPMLHDSGRCWTYPGGLASLKKPGVITLTILPVIEAGLDRKVFQQRLEAALAPRSRMGLDVADAAGPDAADAAPRQRT